MRSRVHAQVGLSARQGSVLIAVLWCLFFLSALAVAIYAYVAPQIGLAQHLKQGAQTYYWAQAGVKKAMFMLDEDETEDYDVFSESWANNEEAFKDIRFGEQGYAVIKHEYVGDDGASETRYGLIDEESKININNATYEVLERLVEVAGQTTSQTAADIADSILDWIDPDADPRPNGAESGYYLSLEEGYSCPNQKFQVLEELFLVKGMTQEIFDRIRGDITVNTSGEVNMNTAGKYVLQALGMNDSLAAKVLQFRRGNDSKEATEDDRAFTSTEGIVTTLSMGVGLSAEETEQINNIITAGLITVRSDHFGGVSSGELRYSAEDEPSAVTRIAFIIDREKHIRYWHEE